jgi:hypothetical protein
VDSYKALSVHGFESDHRPIQTIIRKTVNQEIKSGTFELNTGIPQGSPLSPILFLLFTAPLLKNLEVSLQHVIIKGKTWAQPVKLYAFSFVDDVYYIAVSRSYEINCAGISLLHHSMQGTAKYHVMHLRRPVPGRRNNDKVFSDQIPDIPGFTEAPQKTLTILSVVVDDQLTWEAHIDCIVDKFRHRMRYLKRISGATWGPNLLAVRQYFLTVIRPVVTYACGAWFMKPRLEIWREGRFA